MLPQYKKLSLLVIGCLLLGIATNAQNTPALNQTAPSGTTTVITSPAAINTGGSLMNYIREYKPLLPVTNEASINYTASNVVKSTTYKDGFNRTMQVTTQNIAPGKYLVQPYDTRTQQDQYSYLPYAASSSTYFNPNMFADQRNYYKNLYPGEDSASYSVIKNISDANQRTTKAMAAGKSQVGQQRGTTVQQTTNAANEVRIWTIGTSSPQQVDGTNFNDGTVGGWAAYSSGTRVVENQRLKISVTGQWQGVRKDFTVTPGHQYKVLVDVDKGTITSGISLSLVYTSSWAAITSGVVNQSINGVNMTFTPTSSQISFVIETAGSTTGNFYIDNYILEDLTPGSGGIAKPSSSAYFNAGQLFGELTTSSSGGQSLVYKDKDGHVVYERKYLTDNGTTPVYGVTYYVYDDLGQLRYILPPKAVELSTSGTVSQTVLDNLCFQYKYDKKGRKVEQKMPGKAPEEYVYDKKGRLVMYRDGSLKAQNKWAFTFYDPLDRPVFTGFGGTTIERQPFQDIMEDNSTYPSNHWLYYAKNYDLYYNNVYPSSLPYCDILTYTYYDDYAVIDPSSTLWNTYASVLALQPDLVSATGSETPARSNRTYGMVTGTKVRIFPSPNADATKAGYWKLTANFYDDKGRLIYGVSRDLKQDGTAIHGHYTGTQYNFTNQPLLTKHIATNINSTDAVVTFKEWNRNYYDDALGRLTQSAHKIGDNSTWTISALYAYDDMGRVQRKVLGNYGEVQDMSYNIRGQLAGINGIYAETGDKQSQSRSFGESLKYDYGFTQPKYDGKLAGMVWRGSGTALSNAYGYTYDKSGRLTTADFRKQVPITGGGFGWLNATTDYTVSNLSYDANGNILSMKQRGVKPGTGPVDMDVLGYSYESQSNRLQAVGDSGVPDYGAGDFQNGNTGSVDYTYNTEGQLTSDLNKGIQSVAYNYMAKPERIVKSDGAYIEYSYDATGSKVQELIHDSAGVNTITDYIGNFIYKNNKLQFSLTSEGRAVYNADSNKFKEEFFVKDHLGNVRSTIDVYTYPMLQYLAGYEIASANLENMFFETVDEVRDDKPGSTWNGDLKSARLNGADANRRTGTSLLLKVMAGDKVEMNVNNFYEDYDHEQDQPLSANDVLGSIVSTLTGGGGGFVGGESHNTALVGRVFTPTNYSVFDDILQNATDETKPKAYLNYILFDEGMHIIESQCGSFQANGDGTWQTIGTTAPMEIKVNGYLAVYINNVSQITGCVSCSDVFFDQLLVRFTKGNLKEENHYYPFGLPIVALGSQASGFKDNKYKYQSNEYNKEQGLNWMNFHARAYDPQVGRFLSIDPLADDEGQQGFSPYAAMGNNPSVMIDPNGTTMQVSGDETMARKYLDSWLGHDNYDLTGGVVTILDGRYGAALSHLTSYFMDNNIGGSSASVTYSQANQAAQWLMTIIGDQTKTVNMKVNNNGYVTMETSKNDDDMANGFSPYEVDLYTNIEAGMNRVNNTRIWASVINDMFGKSTFIPGTALSIAGTRGGKLLSMGGSYVFKSSAFLQQMSLGREAAFAGKFIKGGGYVLGGAGILLTTIDIGVNGLNVSNGMDFVIGAVSFVPGVGWVIGVVYFVGNAAVISTTGKSIGDHIQDSYNTTKTNFENIGPGLIETFTPKNPNRDY